MSESDSQRSSRQIQSRLNRQRQLLARLMRSEALTRGDVSAALAQAPVQEQVIQPGGAWS